MHVQCRSLVFVFLGCLSYFMTSCTLHANIENLSSHSKRQEQPADGSTPESGSVIATKLQFSDLPSDARFGLSNGRLTVQAVNDQGLLDTNYNGEVELQVSVDPNGGQTQILKTIRTQANLGVATFEDYLLSKPGFNFKLSAVPLSSSLTPATTPNFNVTRTNLNYGLNYHSLIVAGNRAYASAGYDGVEVYDITTPSNPNKLYTIYTNGQATELVLNGTTLFVLNKWENVSAYNLSNENDIQMYSRLSLSEFANKIALTGSSLFAFDGQYVRIISVSDPSNMSIVASIDTADTTSYRKQNTLEIEGTRLYTRTEGSIFKVYDISTPTSPSFLGSATVSLTSSRDFAVHNQRVYTETSGNLQEINFTTPATPVLTRTFDYWGASNQAIMSVIDDQLFFYSGVNVGLMSLNLPLSAGPMDIVYAREFFNGTNLEVRDVAAGSGTNLFILESNGLRSYSYKKMTATEVGSYNTPGIAYDVEVVGSTAFVADGATGVVLLNVSNPASPALISTYNTAGTAREVIVSGNIVYVADGASGVSCFDIQNPSSPGANATGTIATGGTAYDIEISGNLLAVATGSNVKLYNITGACTFSAQLGSISFSGAQQIAITGNYLFINNNSFGNYVYDISNPSSPTSRIIGGTPQLTEEGGGPMIAHNGYMWSLVNYIINFNRYPISGTEWNSSATLYANSAFAKLRTVEHQNMSSVSAEMAVHNDVIYIPSDDYGWSMVDVSDPDFPKLVYSMDPTSSTNPVQGIAANNDYIYLAKDAQGLVIMQKSTYIPLTRQNEPTSVAVQYSGVNNENYIFKTNGVYKNLSEGLEALSSVSLPAVMSSGLPLYANSNHVVFQDNNCYCNKVFSLADPLNPTLVSETDTFNNFIPSFMTTTRMYGARGTNGVFIYNISSSTANIVGSYNTAGNASDLEIVDNYMYIADNTSGASGFVVLDISTENSPQLVTTLNIPNAKAIARYNNTIYVGSTNGVIVVDITQRNNPSIVRTLTTINNNPTMVSFLVKEGHLLFADNTNTISHLSRVYIYDLRTDAQNPTLVETLLSNENILNITTNSYFIRIHTTNYIKSYFHINYSNFTNNL